MSYRIGIEGNLDKNTIEYRLNNLVFSQNMIKVYLRDKDEFFEKYIMGIFFDEETYEDEKYQKNMEFGRDFHLECQRIFSEIPIYSSESEAISRIRNIKKSYENRFGVDNLEFLPEYPIEMDGRIRIIADLIVKIYREQNDTDDLDKKNGERILERIDIWDWKLEKKVYDDNIAKKSIQTMLYMYVVYEAFLHGYPEECLVMSYYQPMINNRVDIRYSKDMRMFFKEKIDGIIKSIMEEKWQ